MASTSNSKIIHAPAAAVYAAFTDRVPLEKWLAPNGMTGKVLDFDLRQGGGYTMSLTYNDPNIAGKTTANEDRYTATFQELHPGRKIVHEIRFHGSDNAPGAPMYMDVMLEEQATDTTRVTITFRNLPPGVEPKDNETGTKESLEKLSNYLAGA